MADNGKDVNIVIGADDKASAVFDDLRKRLGGLYSDLKNPMSFPQAGKLAGDTQRVADAIKNVGEAAANPVLESFGAQMAVSSNTAKSAIAGIKDVIDGAHEKAQTLSEQWTKATGVMGKFGASVAVAAAGFAAFKEGAAIGAEIAKDPLAGKIMAKFGQSGGALGGKFSAEDYTRSAGNSMFGNFMGLVTGKDVDEGAKARWDANQKKIADANAIAEFQRRLEEAAREKEAAKSATTRAFRNQGSQAIGNMEFDAAHTGQTWTARNRISSMFGLSNEQGQKVADSPMAKSMGFGDLKGLYDRAGTLDKQKQAGDRLADMEQELWDSDKKAAQVMEKRAEGASAILEKSKTATEKYADQWNEIVDYLEAGLLTTDQASKAIAGAKADRDKALKPKDEGSFDDHFSVNRDDSRFATFGPGLFGQSSGGGQTKSDGAEKATIAQTIAMTEKFNEMITAIKAQGSSTQVFAEIN